MSRILLGVCGSVSAYKSLEFVRIAIKSGHAVRVAQTAASLQFVGKASFEAVTGAPSLVGQFDSDPMRGGFPGDELPTHTPIAHLVLVERADVFVIAPATANTIAKLACGISDSLLTDAYLACKVPIVIAAAMNSSMWEHDATSNNVSVLRQRGNTVIDPSTGDLASKGEWGVGRLPDPEQLLEIVEQVALDSGDRRMTGLKVLITAGGTREPIDSVRYLGNRSSGRMGYALATEASRRGAEVTVLQANVNLRQISGVKYLQAGSAAEMHEMASEMLPETDIVLMAAAVADFKPESIEAGKIDKQRGDFNLKLIKTADIVTDLASKRSSGQVIVGFAAEHGQEGIERAKKKLASKGLDMIVFNDISRSDIGFESEENEVVLIDKDGCSPLSKMSKKATAACILDQTMKFLPKGPKE